MNNERRKRLAVVQKMLEAAFEKITEARDLIDEIKDEEQEAFDAMPESFQEGERGQKAQAAIESMQEAYDDLDMIDPDNILDRLSGAAE